MLGGLFFHITGLITIGIYCYLVLLALQLITLPVEFDASDGQKSFCNRSEIVQPGGSSGREQSPQRGCADLHVAAFIAALGNPVVDVDRR